MTDRSAVCLSRVQLGARFPLDVLAGAGLDMFIGDMLNLVFGVPSASPSTARADESRQVQPRLAAGGRRTVS